MATIYISEFRELGDNASGGKNPVAKVPPVAEQTVAIGGASAQSAALSAATNLVRIATDADCLIAFGANPTATATSMRMAANTAEYFGVTPGVKVAVITDV